MSPRATGGIIGLVLAMAGCSLFPSNAPAPDRPIVDSEPVTVETVTGSVKGYLDGSAREALFYSPGGLAQDASGSVYVADTGNQRIRKIDPSGMVTTVATGTVSLLPNGQSPSPDRVSVWLGVAIGKDGRGYVTDSNENRVLVLGPDGVALPFAGGTQGYLDGDRTMARFFMPRDLASDASGDVIVQDGNSVRKIAPDGQVTTLAGGDSHGMPSASFMGVGTDPAGNVYVACGGQGILKVAPDGSSRILVAGGTRYVDGDVANARLGGTQDVAGDAAGNVYFLDWSSLRRLSPTGQVTTLVQRGLNVPGDGGTPSGWILPARLIVEASGSILVSDSGSNRILRVTRGGN